MKNVWQEMSNIKHDLERAKEWCRVCNIRNDIEKEKKDICHLISGIKRIEIAIFNIIEELERYENKS